VCVCVCVCSVIHLSSVLQYASHYLVLFITDSIVTQKGATFFKSIGVFSDE